MRSPYEYIDYLQIVQEADRTPSPSCRISDHLQSKSPITFIDGMLKVQHAFKEVSNPITDFGPPFHNWDIFHWIVMPPEWNGMPPWWQRTIFYPDGKPR